MKSRETYQFIAGVLALGSKPCGAAKRGGSNTAGQEPPDQESAGQESAGQEPPGQESAGQEPPGQESESRSRGDSYSTRNPDIKNNRDDMPVDGSDLQSDRERIVRVIESGGVDWNRFVYIGSNQYVLQALYLKFLNNDILDRLPAELTGHLKNLYELNLERNNIILEHTARINRLLKTHNITPIFMKGLGNILDGLYSTPGERMMLDIDILTGPEQMEEAGRLLIENGFTSVSQYDPGRKEAMKHFPELVREGLPAFVDIHQMPVNIQYEAHFNYETAVQDMRPARGNPDYMVMSDAGKIKLNFIHSQLVHWGHYNARPSLRELYDLLLLSAREDTLHVLTSFSPYRQKAAGYVRVLYSTFGMESELPPDIRQKGRFYLFRHRMALKNPRTGKVIFSLLKAWRLYFAIPLRSLFDKNYRLYVKVRLKDPEWYKRNLRIRKIVEKTNDSLPDH